MSATGEYTKKKPRDREELHRTIMQQARDDLESDFDNREAALDDLDFRAGNQWDPVLRAERELDGRPCPTVNMIPKFVRQVTNDARKNRPSIKVRGVDDEADPETAEVLGGLIRNIEDQCEGVSKAYIPAIDNAATCGIGHFRIKTQYADDGSYDRQELAIEGIPNALAVLWDRLAKDPSRMDADHCFVLDDMDEDAFQEKYPDAATSDFDSDFWHEEAGKTVRIAEYWCKEYYEKTIGRGHDGKAIDLTDIPVPSVKLMGVTETRKVKAHKIVSYIVSGSEILSGPHEFPGKYIPIVPVIGEEVYIGEKRIRYGVVRFAKDPQRLYNFWRAAQAEQLALQPKAPFIATATQIEPYKAVWKQANRRNFPYLPYKSDGTAPPPQRSEPPQGSNAIMQEAMLSADEMKATTGIYDAALGDKSNETSGVAIANRQRESDTSNLHFADNLALSIRHAGRIMIGIIPVVMDTEQVVRLLGEDGAESWERVNAPVMTPEGPGYQHDLTIGKYDVTVKTGPSYATRRMEAADSMMAFIQTVPDAAQFVLDLVAKNMDWPGAEEFAKRFRLMLMKQHPELVEKNDEEEVPPPSPADQMNALMMQAEGRKVEAEARKIEADAEKAEMEAAQLGMELAQVAAVGGPLQMAAIQNAMSALQKAIASPPGQAQGGEPPQSGGGPPASQGAGNMSMSKIAA